MAVNLKGRHFLTLMDFTPEEIRYMLDLAHDLKAKKRAGIHNEVLKGKNVVLLFEKTSTRTRCAFEVAALDEGAHVTFLDSKSSQMGKKETIADTAKVLGRLRSVPVLVPLPDVRNSSQSQSRPRWFLSADRTSHLSRSEPFSLSLLSFHQRKEGSRPQALLPLS